MIHSVAAELLVLRKRVSTWILLLVWVLLGILFAYALPYVIYNSGGPAPVALADLLPEQLTTSLLGGFPFFGGVFALILGVLAAGSEYGWDALKTLLIQRRGRLSMFAAKLVAVAVVLFGFVLVMFLAGAVTSYVIAQVESAPVAWPSAWELLRALAGAWLILGTWAAFGVLLAVLTEGTALAVGLGIVYTLVLEGLLSALATEVGWLSAAAEYFIRANAYSLVTSIGVPTGSVTQNGPGAFAGPFVSGGHALAVLVGYLAVFLAVSAIVLRRRDVT